MKVNDLFTLSAEEYKKTGMDDYFKSNYNDLVESAFTLIYPLKAVEIVLGKIGIDMNKVQIDMDKDIKELDSLDCTKFICDYYTYLWRRKGDEDFTIIRDNCKSPSLEIDMTTHAIFIEALNDLDLYHKLRASVDGAEVAVLLGTAEATGVRFCAKRMQEYEDPIEAFYHNMPILYNYVPRVLNKFVK